MQIKIKALLQNKQRCAINSDFCFEQSENEKSALLYLILFDLLYLPTAIIPILPIENWEILLSFR